MAYFSVQLQLADRTPSRWISPREGQEMIDRGDAMRIKRKAHQPFEIIRLRPQPSASKSPDSIIVLTFSDTEILAGVREVKRQKLETLRAKQEHFRPSPLSVVYA